MWPRSRNILLPVGIILILVALSGSMLMANKQLTVVTIAQPTPTLTASVYLTDANGNWVKVTPTSSLSSKSPLGIKVTIDQISGATIMAIIAQWRSYDTGQTGSGALTGSGPTFTGTLTLNPGKYDVNIYASLNGISQNYGPLSTVTLAEFTFDNSNSTFPTLDAATMQTIIFGVIALVGLVMVVFGSIQFVKKH